MWEETLAAGRAAGIPTESILDATARVFLAQDTFTQAMASAYRQQLTAQILEQEEERSALVEALLSRRITDSQSLWEAADLLRCRPLARSRGCSRVAGNREIGLARDRKQARRPRHPVGVAAAAGLTRRHRPRADTRHGQHVDFSASPARDSPGRRQPAISRFGRDQRCAAIRAAGGDRKAVAGLADHGVRRHPACHCGGERPEVMAKIRSSVLRRLIELPIAERTILFDTFKRGCRKAAPPTTPRRRSSVIPTPCGTGFGVSRS